MIDTLSIYLAKLLGLSFLIIGIALLFKTKDFQNTAKDVAKSNAFMTLISIIPLVIGLSIIIGHNIWEKNWTIIVTIVGWLIFIAGIIRLFFHKHIMKTCAKISKNKKAFVWAGIILIIIGLYLAGKGFFEETFLF